MTPDEAPSPTPTDVAHAPTPDEIAAAGNAARRRSARGAKMGDVLATITSDETGTGWNEPDRGDRDEDLIREVPPHHG
ncbi:MAG: hypothetical protein ACRDP1_17535 [Nocardioidaceae bacterium]